MRRLYASGNIVGIIDHHALQSNTIITEKPIFVDIRPWWGRRAWGHLSDRAKSSYVKSLGFKLGVSSSA